MSSSHHAKYLRDYSAPDYAVDALALEFDLAETQTRVKATSQLRRVSERVMPLWLDGIDLTLISLKIDGVEHNDYEIKEHGLLLKNLPAECALEIITEISPKTNTSLEGLYLSGGAYCTQCEAEGFRKITYFMDRPDVLTTYDVIIRADKAFPYLLSNGNKVAEGTLADGRHFCQWQDPFKKPSYLFALVAGDFDVLEDTFTRQSGKPVKLALFVDKGNLDKAPHAMTSLKKAMRWDETRFGLEYDLDIYMIVAVDFFNMGAMENKGLNVFNSKCVLANPRTATDRDFHMIESIIGHEYFHNWTGNRVTCRDWFQLSLKEGLTVFRDQEFSSDMGSRALNRIDAVKVMRTHQFAEDAGPMAHPIRPEKVIEMNNFYTVTVYDKGAEVIRMMHTLLGEAGFRQGMDLYFERHDGEAVTCDDFVAAMSDATGKDLSLFKRWYSQSGTSRVTVAEHFDKDSETYSLTLSQMTPATPDQATKQPLHIPFAIELLSREGVSLKRTVLDFKEETHTFSFDGISEKPVPVLLEDFSAPCILEFDYPVASLIHIMRFASSDFAKWDAQQSLFTYLVNNALSTPEDAQLPDEVLEALQSVLTEQGGDLALKAELLKLPSFETLTMAQQPIAVDDTLTVVARFEMQIATALKPRLLQALSDLPLESAMDAEQAAIRALRNVALYYLAKVSSPEVDALLAQQFESNNMTHVLGVLSACVNAGHSNTEDYLTAFEANWQDDVLVLDKWFALNAQSQADDVIEKLKSLYQHPKFDFGNPNRTRALVGTFAMANPKQFHRIDGKGYQLLLDLLIKLNDINPQNASRLITPFLGFKRFDEKRKAMMKNALKTLAAMPDLSADLFEKVDSALKSDE